MNAQLEILASLATTYFPKTETSGEYWMFDKEKFAELIVKECGGIYSKIDNGNQHLGTDDYLEALQKHFGVE